MVFVGFGDDEAYTLVIARHWALSYFDHPPLHQWIAHGFVALVGEGHVDRLPFWALLVAANLPLYGLTNRLFGRDAGLWALFAFNASAYFLVLPDGYILPDAALLPLLAAAVWAIVEVTFEESVDSQPDSHGALRPPLPARGESPSTGSGGVRGRLRDGAASVFAGYSFGESSAAEPAPHPNSLPASGERGSPAAVGSTAGAWALWLAGGAALGLAGLAKYLAVFVPLGLFGFFVFSPLHRRWFARPEPYVAAALALATFSPALIWNAENGWVSFAFQTSRGSGGWSFDGRAWGGALDTALEQAASLTPWVMVPVVISLVAAARAKADSGERLLLWLTVPTLVVFALLPFDGKRAIPHWFNSGWLFACPLAGAWLAARTPRRVALWAKISAALSLALVAIYLPVVMLGPTRALPFLPPLAHDPTGASFDWPDLSSSAPWRAGGPPAFVVVEHWRDAGRVGIAFGPSVPVCLFGLDPRELAFACDSRDFVGRDALIVAPAGGLAPRIAALAPYFERIDPAEIVAIGRFGATERRLALARAHNLLRPYPLPYGPGR